MSYKIIKKKSGDFEICIGQKLNETFSTIEDAVKHILKSNQISHMEFKSKGKNMCIVVKVVRNDG